MPYKVWKIKNIKIEYIALKGREWQYRNIAMLKSVQYQKGCFGQKDRKVSASTNR